MTNENYSIEELPQLYNLILGEYQRYLDDESKCYLVAKARWGVMLRRKRILNQEFLKNLDSYIPVIKEFNDCLLRALRDMYDKAKALYDVVKDHPVGKGEDLEVLATIRLGEVSVIDGLDKKTKTQWGMTERGMMWECLCDPAFNPRYAEGIAHHSLVFSASSMTSWEEYIGQDAIPWNAHIESDKTKDIPFIKQWHNLYVNSYFALPDFINCRTFETEITMKVEDRFCYRM